MYVYVCDACLDEKHGSCEMSRDLPDPSDGLLCGGGRCVCQCDKENPDWSHKFYLSIRDSSLEYREHKRRKEASDIT